MSIDKLKDKCAAFGIGYFGDDPECSDCDVSKMCNRKTNELNKKTKEKETMSLEKLLKEAKKLKKKGDLADFIEEHDLDVDVKKSDTVAKMLKKVEAALEEEFEEVEDEDADGDEDDDADEDDDGDEDGDEDGEDEDEDDDVDLMSMTKKDLLAYCKENELEPPKKAKKTTRTLRDWIEANSENDADDGEDDGEDDGDAPDLPELEERIKALETRVAELQSKFDDAGVKPKVSKASAKKAEIEKLMKKVPYSQKALKDMGGRTLKRLASGLGINSFGKTTDAVYKLVVKEQKKKKWQK